jgi:hypothetical protein
MDIRTWTLLCACIIIAAVLLSGCIGQKAQNVTQTGPPAVFIDFQRTGGVSGQEAHLLIFDNGAGIVSSGSSNAEIALNQTDLSRITGLFDYAQYSMLQANYPALHAGTDLVTYTVSYHGKTVTMQETAIPPSFEPVLDQLNRLVNTAVPQKQETRLANIRI